MRVEYTQASSGKQLAKNINNLFKWIQANHKDNNPEVFMLQADFKGRVGAFIYYKEQAK